ncbi:MAG: Spo0B domain-containing protein [Desulfotomaculaceae bacterium]
MDYIATYPMLFLFVQAVINGILPTVSVVLVGSALIGIRMKIEQFLLLCVSGYIVFFTVHYFQLDTGPDVVVLIGGMALASFFILKVDVLTALSIAVIGEFLDSIIKTYTLNFYFYISNTTIAASKANLNQRYAVLLICGIAVLLVYAIVRRYDLSLLRLLRTRGIYSEEERQQFIKKLLPMIMLLLTPVIAIIYLNDATQIFLDKGVLADLWNAIKFIDTFLIIALTGTSIYAIIKITIFMGEDYVFRATAQHLPYLENLILSIRKQKHDFSIHLDTIKGLIDFGEYEQAREHINSIYQERSVQREILRTDNPMISALIYSRVGLAESKGIDIKLSITGSLNNLRINNTDLISIIGNLLDNAIEATENSATPNKEISVIIDRQDNSLAISTTNNCSAKEEEAVLMLQPNYSTKGQGC